MGELKGETKTPAISEEMMGLIAPKLHQANIPETIGLIVPELHQLNILKTTGLIVPATSKNTSQRGLKKKHLNKNSSKINYKSKINKSSKKVSKFRDKIPYKSVKGGNS